MFGVGGRSEALFMDVNSRAGRAKILKRTTFFVLLVLYLVRSTARANTWEQWFNHTKLLSFLYTWQLVVVSVPDKPTHTNSGKKGPRMPKPVNLGKLTTRAFSYKRSLSLTLGGFSAPVSKLFRLCHRLVYRGIVPPLVKYMALDGGVCHGQTLNTHTVAKKGPHMAQESKVSQPKRGIFPLQKPKNAPKNDYCC